MKELKNCPCCDSNNVMCDQDYQDYPWSVFCEDCGVEITRIDRQEAIDAWNTRPVDKIKIKNTEG